MFDVSTLDYSVLLSPFFASVVGGVTALLFQPIIKRIDSRVELSARVWSRIQDKRFSAYEAILQTSKELRMTIPTLKHCDGFIETKPYVLSFKEDFQKWSSDIFQRQDQWDDWIDQSTSAELKYLMDYLVNLRIAVRATDQDEFDALGVEVKHDFIALSVLIQKSANQFFKKIDQKNLGYSGNGKLKLIDTQRRLGETRLFKWMKDRDLFIKNGDLVRAFDEQTR